MERRLNMKVDAGRKAPGKAVDCLLCAQGVQEGESRVRHRCIARQEERLAVESKIESYPSAQQGRRTAAVGQIPHGSGQHAHVKFSRTVAALPVVHPPKALFIEQVVPRYFGIDDRLDEVFLVADNQEAAGEVDGQKVAVGKRINPYFMPAVQSCLRRVLTRYILTHEAVDQVAVGLTQQAIEYLFAPVLAP
jgi:hypothetical protein